MAILNIGILGFGNIARVHLDILLKLPGVAVKAIYSRSDKSHQIPKDITFYRNYETLIEREKLDAVLVCTPTHTHQEIACKCAENGLNIFLEKPMALSIEECQSILDSVKENRIKLLIGHVLRFWPTYGSVHKYISNSKLDLGDLKSFVAKRLGTFPWSNWFADQNKSGGVILDLSIHDIDYALWMCDSPKSVSCQASHIEKFGMRVLGESVTRIKFDNNLVAECEASWAKPKDFEFFTSAKLEGTLNTIEFNGREVKENQIFKITNIFPSEDGYYNQMAHFCEVLSEKNKRFSIEPIEGLQAVRVCLAAIKSAQKKGKEIDLESI